MNKTNNLRPYKWELLLYNYNHLGNMNENNGSKPQQWELLSYIYFRKYERGTWLETSHGGSIVTINAFYSPNSNTMIVPIGKVPIYSHFDIPLFLSTFWLWFYKAV